MNSQVGISQVFEENLIAGNVFEFQKNPPKDYYAIKSMIQQGFIFYFYIGNSFNTDIIYEKENMKPLFYVELKNKEKKPSSLAPLLPGFEEENESGMESFSMNKQYPVISIIDGGNIQIPDDNGVLRIVNNRFFKYSDGKK